MLVCRAIRHKSPPLPIEHQAASTGTHELHPNQSYNSYIVLFSRLVQEAVMQRRKLVCSLLCWLACYAVFWSASTSSSAAANKTKGPLDDGGVPLELGYREHGDYPSPRCCMAGSCAANRTGQHAFVTSVRTAKYVPLLRQLVCSLAESNPGEQVSLLL